MEATNKNVEIIRNNLVFHLIFLHKKYNWIGKEKLQEMDKEIDRKIARLLPGYDGSITPKEAFWDAIERTAETFVKKM